MCSSLELTAAWRSASRPSGSCSTRKPSSTTRRVPVSTGSTCAQPSAAIPNSTSSPDGNRTRRSVTTPKCSERTTGGLPSTSNQSTVSMNRAGSFVSSNTSTSESGRSLPRAYEPARASPRISDRPFAHTAIRSTMLCASLRPTPSLGSPSLALIGSWCAHARGQST